MSFTFTQTFTRTHAKHLASKVVADLYQCSLLYDEPSEAWIDAYEQELTTLLAGQYVETYEFGFNRNRQRVLSWHYTVGQAGDLQGDSRSGSMLRGVQTDGARYFNFLSYSDTWFSLSPTEREAVKATLPFQRATGAAPIDGAGYWKTEQSYTAGGMLVQRRVFRPW